MVAHPYLSVARMCMSLSRNSLNMWGQVEERCTWRRVRNSCMACVAVGPTWELCWLVPWGLLPDRKRTSTCTSVGSDTICWAVLSWTLAMPLLAAGDDARGYS